MVRHESGEVMSSKNEINVEWHERLASLLIRAGTTGKKQSEIVKALQGFATAATLEGQLEAWWAEDKVQRFTVPPPERGGRSTIVWRATTKLVEQEKKDA